MTRRTGTESSLAAPRMFDPDDTSPSLSEIREPVPLFPLANPAFFPHTILPLHIFEPRYRQMTADALRGERLIAVAQFVSGWELLPEPLPIEPYVCLGRIHACEHLPDGRYALVLDGVARATVLSEAATDRPYRLARVELIPDQKPPIGRAEQERRSRDLLDAFCDLHPRSTLEPMLRESAEATIPLGTLCDLVASAVPLSPVQSQQLLAESDVDRRYACILAHLQRLRRKSSGTAGPASSPPDFSSN